MTSLVLALTLVAANDVEGVASLGDEPWAGENRRVHAGIGARVHGGVVDSNGFPLWALQSELFGTLSIRLRGHDELRVQLGLFVGWPDMWGGESNVSFVHALGPRVSVGLGGFVFLGPWSMRAGLEVPLIFRIGSSRRHQLVVSARAHAGVFDNVPITGWRLTNQRFAIAGDVAAGYAFQF